MKLYVGGAYQGQTELAERENPGEEIFPEFTARCLRAFEELRERKMTGDCALIVHGGTVMAIMEAYAQPHAGYYDFQVKNGQGYILEENGTYGQIPAGCDRI